MTQEGPRIRVLPDALGDSTQGIGRASRAGASSRTRVVRQGVRWRIPQLREQALAIETAGRKFEDAVVQVTRNEAHRIKSRLQLEVQATYRRAATGRFARGINTRVTLSKNGDRLSTSIQITLPGYRETRFLTNVGNRGRFKIFPVGPYLITAKGVGRGIFDPLNPPGRSELQFFKRDAIRKARSRLKVPLANIELAATVGYTGGYVALKPKRPGGREELAPANPFDPTDPGSPIRAKGGQFIYPLWVTHPGFERDVVSDILEEEGFNYQEAILANAPLLVPEQKVTLGFGRGGFQVRKAGDSDLLMFAKSQQRHLTAGPVKGSQPTNVQGTLFFHRPPFGDEDV